ncbi:MAG: BlaI/MecI/CopY family transcriptional regulator [Acidimicrobiia bacterium]
MGELEAEVLAALASSEVAVTAATVRALVGDDLAYTTVATILNRLCDKGLAARDREGRSFRYSLAVDEADLVAERMRVQLRHAHDPMSALGQFVSGLDPTEEQALRRVLAELERRP